MKKTRCLFVFVLRNATRSWRRALLMALSFTAAGAMLGVFTLGFATQTAAADFTFINLNPTGFVFSEAVGAFGGQQVGFGFGGATGGANHALLWSGSGAGVVDLNPTGFSMSDAFAIAGGQQVGSGMQLTTLATHALLWTGTAASAVDLNPSGFTFSTALGTSGSQQGGSGGGPPTGFLPHALLWTGTASSAVDLNPPGFFSSEIRGVSGGQQVGIGNFTRAMLWTGTAASAVDLTPPGSIFGQALGVSAGQQVGFGIGGPDFNRHAVLWTGTAASAVDLNPSGFFFSVALGVSGGQQVGFGAPPLGHTHALLWTGTAASVVDLNAFLPPGLTDAEATGIDSSGNIVGFASGPSSGGFSIAVLWQSRIPAAFSAKLKIHLASSSFDLNSNFTLGAGGSIAPLTQDMTVQIGGYSVTIPAGSFTQPPNGKFVFEGTISAVPLEAILTPLSSNSYEFRLVGEGAPNLPTSNPVTVVFTIGNNIGMTTVTAEFPGEHGFVFTTFDVPFTPGFSPVETEANGINILGQIVGDYSDSNTNFTHGYLRDPDGTFTPIDFPFAGGVFETSPKDINVKGVIVGQYFPIGSPAQCFILQDGQFTTINFQGPGFSGTINTGCRGINNRGQIVGRYRDPITHLRHGFLLNDGTFTTIDFPGAAETIARRINNRGQIVGGYSTDPIADRFHGFMLDKDGQFTKIDFPGAIETFAADINDRGEIVGQYADSSSDVHGFLLTKGVYTEIPLPGVPQNLGSFTTDSANFSIGITGITNSGEITGLFMTADGNFHGFLGTRVP